MSTGSHSPTLTVSLGVKPYAYKLSNNQGKGNSYLGCLKELAFLAWKLLLSLLREDRVSLILRLFQGSRRAWYLETFSHMESLHAQIIWVNSSWIEMWGCSKKDLNTVKIKFFRSGKTLALVEEVIVSWGSPTRRFEAHLRHAALVFVLHDHFALNVSDLF